MPWIRTHKRAEESKISLAIHVQPGASKAKIAGFYGERLKVVVSAPPVDGKANKDVERLLAKVIDISVKNISVSKGMTSRQKMVTISGVDEDEIRHRIALVLST